MTRTKKWLFAAAGASLLWISGAAARADEENEQGSEEQTQHQQQQGMQQGSEQGSDQESEQAQGGKKKMERMRISSARVEKVDLDKRLVTLRSSQGKPFTVEVPSSVTRLQEVKPGDTVSLSFYESVALSLQRAGEGAPSAPSEQTTISRGTGDLPSGTKIHRVTAEAKVTGIDKEKNELTLQLPSGQSDTIEVSNPQVRAQLKNIKVGDKIRATYTQAMATKVTRM